MKKSITILTSLAIICYCFIQAVNEDGFGPFQPSSLSLEIPKGWPEPNNIFKKNKLTVEGFNVGRRLFYDPLLSKDSSISCASCHQQFAAFSTFDHDLSHGVANTFTTRNAPALFNIAWMKEMHWDGGINHLEVQPLAPLTNPNEMGSNIANIIQYLNDDTSYQRMFKAAFGDAKINSQRVLKALAQFTGSMISANSKYDKVKRGEASFSKIEERGYALFKKNCAACHAEPLFTDNSFRNNGQSLNRFKDYGRQMITGQSKDSLKFKVPSLRNVQVTAPYMHDGNMFGLPQVIEHYAKGIKTEQPTLDPLLKNRLEINNKELYDLMYFLFTLTDSSYLKDPRFSGRTSNVHNNHN